MLALRLELGLGLGLLYYTVLAYLQNGGPERTMLWKLNTTTTGSYAEVSKVNPFSSAQ